MTEFDLIEIAKRFRALEDLLEKADLILAARSSFLANRGNVEQAEELDGLRGDIDIYADRCRADLTAMQEVIRCQEPESSYRPARYANGLNLKACPKITASTAAP